MRRQAIASRYDRAFVDQPAFQPLHVCNNVRHAYHLYVIRLRQDFLRADRDRIFRALRAEGIGVNVHYLPVYLHPFYQARFPETTGSCPVAEDAYRDILSLPLFPAMTDSDVEDVIRALLKVINAYALDSRFAATACSG